MDKVLVFVQHLRKTKPNMDFFQFESAMINKFEDEADGLDIQDWFIFYKG
jgi:hypothetical protein